MNWLASKLRRPHERRALMVGLDNAGRTTILYHWKLGEVVTTIPTIGFNVESILRKRVNFTVWDVGGCDKLRPLWRHYYQNTDILIFVIDVRDRDRIGEAIEELEKMLADDELRECVCLVLANKCDLDEIMPKEALEPLLEPVVGRNGRPFRIQYCSGATGQGIYDALDWLANQMTGGCSNKREKASRDDGDDDQSHRRTPKLTKGGVFACPSREELLEKARTGSDLPEDPDMFLSEFSKGKVVVFDHRAHLRVGYLVLSRAVREGLTPTEAVDKFTKVLKAFFENADKTQIRPTYHVTMTIFWCHAINLALTAFSSQLLEEDPSVLLQNSENDLFQRFLVTFPELQWSGLWSRHYKKDTIMSSDARARFVLPDLQPFPAYMTLQSPSAGKLSSSHGIPNDLVSDEEFSAAFDSQTLCAFDTTSLVRICFLKIRDFNAAIEEGSKIRRSEIVTELMEKLERLSIVLRAAGESKYSFSHTETYFWIQMTSAALGSLRQHETPTNDQHTKRVLPFSSFMLLFPELQPSNEPWKAHWSEPLFTCREARRSFVMPDKEQLPNILQTRAVDSSLLQKAWRVSARPTPSTMQIVAEYVIEKTLVELCSDDDLLDCIHDGSLQKLCHLDLVRMMFLHVVGGWNRGDRGTIAVSRIFDELDHYYQLKSGDNRRMLSVEDANDMSSDDVSFQWISRHCSEDRYTSSMTGMTHVHFWIQMVVANITRAIHTSPKCLLSFSDYITSYPEVLWDDLWRLYYTPITCFSQEGRVLVLPPDVAQIPAHISLPTHKGSA